MSVEVIETIKQQIITLSSQQRSELTRFLVEQEEKDKLVAASATAPRDEMDAFEHKRQQHMEWMKAHREEYAGQYVALEGNHLVGQGRTLAEAHQQARQNGVHDPFLVRLTSENDVLCGGW